jgi:hypothetical protein
MSRKWSNYVKGLKELRELSKLSIEELRERGVNEHRIEQINSYYQMLKNRGINMNRRSNQRSRKNVAIQLLPKPYYLNKHTIDIITSNDITLDELFEITDEHLAALGIKKGQRLIIQGWQNKKKLERFNARQHKQSKVAEELPASVSSLFNREESRTKTEATNELCKELQHESSRRKLDDFMMQLTEGAIEIPPYNYTIRLKQDRTYLSTKTQKHEIYYNWLVSGEPFGHLSIHKGMVHLKIDHGVHKGRREINIFKYPNSIYSNKDDYTYELNACLHASNTAGSREAVLHIADQLVFKVMHAIQAYYESEGKRCVIKTTCN